MPAAACRCCRARDRLKGDAGIILGYGMDDAVEFLKEDGKRFLLVVARHDDGNERYSGLPRIRLVVAIVTEGVFAIHIDFPLLFFDLCHGVEDKTGRET